MKRNFEEYHYLGGISIIRLNFIQKILYLRAVSYTHLDVYKRQHQWCWDMNHQE